MRGHYEPGMNESHNSAELRSHLTHDMMADINLTMHNYQIIPHMRMGLNSFVNELGGLEK